MFQLCIYIYIYIVHFSTQSESTTTCLQSEAAPSRFKAVAWVVPILLEVPQDTTQLIDLTRLLPTPQIPGRKTGEMKR